MSVPGQGCRYALRAVSHVSSQKGKTRHGGHDHTKEQRLLLRLFIASNAQKKVCDDLCGFQLQKGIVV